MPAQVAETALPHPATMELPAAIQTAAETKRNPGHQMVQTALTMAMASRSCQTAKRALRGSSRLYLLLATRCSKPCSETVLMLPQGKTCDGLYPFESLCSGISCMTLARHDQLTHTWPESLCCLAVCVSQHTAAIRIMCAYQGSFLWFSPSILVWSVSSKY